MNLNCRGNISGLKIAEDIESILQKQIVVDEKDTEVINLSQELDKKFVQGTKYFEIRLLYGLCSKFRGIKVHAVELTSKLGDRQKQVFLLKEFISGDKQLKDKIEETLNLIGHLGVGDIRRLKEQAEYMKLNNIYDEVRDLNEFIMEPLNNIEANKHYLKIKNYIRQNNHLFATKTENNFSQDEHVGIILDNKHYVKKYGEEVVAIKVDEVRDILDEDAMSTIKFKNIKLGLSELGVLIWSVDGGRHKINLGNNQEEKCLLFRV